MIEIEELRAAVEHNKELMGAAGASVEDFISECGIDNDALRPFVNEQALEVIAEGMPTLFNKPPEEQLMGLVCAAFLHGFLAAITLLDDEQR